MSLSEEKDSSLTHSCYIMNDKIVHKVHADSK